MEIETSDPRDLQQFGTDDLAVINKCLQEKSFRRVPILSEGRLVGIVSRTDIMRAILRERRK